MRLDILAALLDEPTIDSLLRAGTTVGSGHLYDLGCSEPLRAPCRYENLVQVRCLLEGVSEDDILQNWHTILPHSMQRWHLDRQEVRQSSPAIAMLRGCWHDVYLRACIPAMRMQWRLTSQH